VRGFPQDGLMARTNQGMSRCPMISDSTGFPKRMAMPQKHGEPETMRATDERKEEEVGEGVMNVAQSSQGGNRRMAAPMASGSAVPSRDDLFMFGIDFYLLLLCFLFFFCSLNGLGPAGSTGTPDGDATPRAGCRRRRTATFPRMPDGDELTGEPSSRGTRLCKGENGTRPGSGFRASVPLS